jgi:cytochrome c-type biogenesis protein CcmH
MKTLSPAFRLPTLRKRGLGLLAAVLLGLAGLAGAAPPAAAMVIDQPLPDPAAEARAIELSKGLRCLVCQNQSIEDSNAELAHDLRRIVRERIAAGDDDATVKAYLVARYGDWVLLKPPFKGLTLILWLAPAVLLASAFALARTVYRRQPGMAPPAPLSADEQARVASLTQDSAASGPTSS